MMDEQKFAFQNGVWKTNIVAGRRTITTVLSTEKWNFYKAISPLLLVFRFYAIELTLQESRRRLFVALRAFYLVYQLLGFVVLFANFLSKGTDVQGISYLCTVVMANSVFFVTIVNLQVKREMLKVLLSDINQLVSCFSDGPRLCKWVHWVIIAFCLFLFCSSFGSLAKYYYLMLSGSGNSFGSRAYHNGVVPQNQTSGFAFDGVELFVYLWVTFMFYAYMATIVLFCAVLWGLNFSLVSLRSLLKEQRRHRRHLIDITPFLHLHCEASRLVQSADRCYREILLVWCVVEMVCAVFAGRAANFDKLAEIRPSFVSAFVGMSALFLVKVLAASAANSHVMESLKEISFVDDLTIQDLSPSSTALAVRIKLYIQHIQISTPAITGWGLVVISKDVAVAAVGNILTYILVLYDK